ncbi:hypothetical protein [Shewanella sp. 10N.286.52.A9]|uniref:hypothetical protein n=1 Tax=Shewanella sp. 10N.286.52.A9 TaxID=3229711 RepID=UPI0035519B78
MNKRNSNESFSIAYREATHLYIAYSPTSHLFKIGITKHISERIKALNIHKPDGSSDWQYLAEVNLGENITGIIETQLACSLQKFNVHRYFEGKRGYCKELYSCTIQEIVRLLNYRLLPEERSILNFKIQKRLSTSQWQIWLNRPYYIPRKTDNWNVKKGLHKPLNNKGKEPQISLNGKLMNPFVQMLKDNHGLKVTY